MVLQIIDKYFPRLNEVQKTKLSALLQVYTEWNQKINVISRKDMESFYVHHVLHSLSVALFVQWPKGTKILDLGCGGGFPGIPLAILFPDIEFTLIDGTAKKIKVVNAVIEELQLDNVKAFHSRAEEQKLKFHFVLSRAVAPLHQLLEWSKPLLLSNSIHALPNGLIAYKGGDLKEELRSIPSNYFAESWPIREKISEEYFETKYLVYVSF